MTKRLSLLREGAIFFSLFVVWQYGVWLNGRGSTLSKAVPNGLHIWHIEQTLHIGSEQWIQNVSRPLWTFADTYYAFAHIFVMLAFVVYVAVLHRDYWRYFRLVMFTTTFIGLAIQLAITSAPPRLIGIPHMVDTATKSGMSIYAMAGSTVDQYSTFPSLHVAWAAIVALCAMRICKSKIRYLWFMHLPLTVYVVVVTGNHFWLDCIFGVIITVIPLWLFRRIPQIP